MRTSTLASQPFTASSVVRSADELAQEVFARLVKRDYSELIADPKGCLLQIAADVLDEWKAT